MIGDTRGSRRQVVLVCFVVQPSACESCRFLNSSFQSLITPTHSYVLHIVLAFSIYNKQNPVHVRHVDSSTLAFSLSSHRLIHKFCMQLWLFPFIINKQKSIYIRVLTCNPVCARDVLDPPVSAFSLSLYRHPFLDTLFNSRFTLIINNNQGMFY